MIENLLMSENILCLGPLLVIPAMFFVGIGVTLINAYQKSRRSRHNVKRRRKDRSRPFKRR